MKPATSSNEMLRPCVAPSTPNVAGAGWVALLQLACTSAVTPEGREFRVMRGAMRDRDRPVIFPRLR